MKKIIAAIMLFHCFTAVVEAQHKISAIGPGWSRTMVNAAIFRKNAITSHGKMQVVAYYDSTQHVVLASRTLGSTTWDVYETPYSGNALDAHNAISIMFDGEGYLHMAWDHHNNGLNYCRSKAPFSMVMEPKQDMVDVNEEKVTYPEFHQLPSGDLLFVYRDGGSGNGNMVMNRYDAKKKTWSRVHHNIVDGEGKRNAYWQMFVNTNGTVHLSWVWREHYNVETNHDMCYAVSKDEGRTWYTSKGKKYNLPITLESAEYAWQIPQNSDLINQTSMTADAADHPYIATYFQAASDTSPQFYVIYNTTGTWQLTRAGLRKTDFNLGGAGTRSIPVSRPQLLYLNSTDKNDRIIMLYRDEEHQDRAVMVSSPPREFQWRTEKLTNFSLDRWEPSYDTELLKQNRLHIYLQKVGQESGEKATTMKPQMVHVLEVNLEEK